MRGRDAQAAGVEVLEDALRQVEAAAPALGRQRHAPVFDAYDRATRAAQGEMATALAGQYEGRPSLSPAQHASVLARAAALLYRAAGVSAEQAKARFCALVDGGGLFEDVVLAPDAPLPWGALGREEQAALARRLPVRMPVALCCRAATAGTWLQGALAPSRYPLGVYLAAVPGLLAAAVDSAGTVRLRRHVELSEMPRAGLTAPRRELIATTLIAAASAARLQGAREDEWMTTWCLLLGLPDVPGAPPSPASSARAARA